MACFSRCERGLIKFKAKQLTSSTTVRLRRPNTRLIAIRTIETDCILFSKSCNEGHGLE